MSDATLRHVRGRVDLHFRFTLRNGLIEQLVIEE
jgi:hypothetical protein